MVRCTNEESRMHVMDREVHRVATESDFSGTVYARREWMKASWTGAFIASPSSPSARDTTSHG